MQNFRIILGKYLNVKLAAHNILENRLHTHGADTSIPMPARFSCLFGLFELFR